MTEESQSVGEPELADSRRFRLDIAYDGTGFTGWAKQPGIRTVQGELEAALATVFRRFAPTPLLTVAGRTDAGVHARGQVAHLDLAIDRPEKVADALNFHLRPAPIVVLKAERVDETFHARFSATARHYTYVILNRRGHLSLDAGLAWRVPSRLDVAAMDAAAQHLLGHHDFTTFRAMECQAASPVKTLDAINVIRMGERIEITCSAQSFLHRQVRSMVGSLVEVGRGFRKPDWIGEILAATDRTACGPVAPSDGLYLERVDYSSAG